MRKRLEALKNDQKGFTLVELIVVLVILAIMAALLVPALLGYVDRAKEGKYLEEARTIYTAIQVINDERYAKSGKPVAKTGVTDQLTIGEIAEVNKLITPTALGSIDSITYSNNADSHAKFVVTGMTIKFNSQDGNTTNITATLSSGQWSVDLSSATGV